jgi:hypothetical protein
MRDTIEQGAGAHRRQQLVVQAAAPTKQPAGVQVGSALFLDRSAVDPDLYRLGDAEAERQLHHHHRLRLGSVGTRAR